MRAVIHIRKLSLLVTLVGIVSCGGSAEMTGTQQQKQQQKAIDPAVRIHIADRLDAATAMGRATWNVFALLYSADPNQAGIAFWSGPNQHGDICSGYGTDSLGQRQVIVLGLADTMHTTVQKTADSLAHEWFNGNHTLPAGWASLASDSVDWGVSAQFDAGHGRTIDDPIRWTLTWTSPATTVRAESSNDPTCLLAG